MPFSDSSNKTLLHPGTADAQGETAPPSEPAAVSAAPVAAPAPAAAAPIQHSRAGSIWVGAIAAGLVVVALIIFIAQNSQQVSIHFLGLDGHFSLALALLATAIAGLLLAAIPGSVRIVQLRRALKRQPLG